MTATASTAPIAGAARDLLDRPLSSLRISVIDRCDLRCRYCMPGEEYVWLPREDLLSFAEFERLVRVFAGAGARKVRITGGEPLLRPELPELVGRIARLPAIEDLAMTTNATRLDELAAPLKEAGLRRLTASLDTLREDRFAALTRRRTLARVLAGMAAAAAVGFDELKINAVVMRGFNDDELVDLLEYGREIGAEVRFIEYMDVGGATHWSPAQVVGRDEILQQLRAACGPIEEEGRQGSAPAQRFRLADGTRFGIVASVTAPFCRACDRSRLTADGLWYLCLYAVEGHDLRSLLRGGATDGELLEFVRSAWRARAERGAEERLRLPERGALFPPDELRLDPHREMHTRGG